MSIHEKINAHSPVGHPWRGNLVQIRPNNSSLYVKAIRESIRFHLKPRLQATKGEGEPTYWVCKHHWSESFFASPEKHFRPSSTITLHGARELDKTLGTVRHADPQNSFVRTLRRVGEDVPEKYLRDRKYKSGKELYVKAPVVDVMYVREVADSFISDRTKRAYRVEYARVLRAASMDTTPTVENTCVITSTANVPAVAETPSCTVDSPTITETKIPEVKSPEGVIPKFDSISQYLRKRYESANGNEEELLRSDNFRNHVLMWKQVYPNMSHVKVEEKKFLYLCLCNGDHNPWSGCKLIAFRAYSNLAGILCEPCQEYLKKDKRREDRNRKSTYEGKDRTDPSSNTAWTALSPESAIKRGKKAIIKVNNLRKVIRKLEWNQKDTLELCRDNDNEKTFDYLAAAFQDCISRGKEI
jgi:hypothetical protein